MPQNAAPSRFTVLRGEGTSLVLEQPDQGLPVVLHWGADLGALSDDDLVNLSSAVSRQTLPGTLDAPWQTSILPQEADGWFGRPGAVLSREGAQIFPRWTVTSRDSDGRVLALVAGDEANGLRLRTHLGIEAGGVVTDWVGDPDEWLVSGNILAGPPAVHAALLEVTRVADVGAG